MQRFQQTDPATVTGIVSGGHFLSHVYLLAFPPLFPMLRNEFKLSNAELGLIFSLVSLAPLFLQIPFGGLVDRIGSKRIFVFGLLSTSLGTILVGLASSYMMILVFVLLAGIGQSTFHPADYALLERVSDPATRGKIFSAHTFAGYLGFAAAPPVVGGLGVLYGWRPALLVTGTIGIVYTVFAYMGMASVHLRHLHTTNKSEQQSDDEPSFREQLQALTSPELLSIFIFFTVLTMATAGIQSFTTVFVETLGYDAATGNAVLTAFLTSVALGVVVGGFLTDTYTTHSVIIVTIGGAAFGMWIIVSGLFPVHVITLFTLFTVVGILNGLALPSRDSLVTESTAAEETGQSFGFVYTGVSFALVVTPFVLGVVIDIAGALLAFAFIGGFYAIGSVIIVVFRYTFR